MAHYRIHIRNSSITSQIISPFFLPLIKVWVSQTSHLALITNTLEWLISRELPENPHSAKMSKVIWYMGVEWARKPLKKLHQKIIYKQKNLNKLLLNLNMRLLLTRCILLQESKLSIINFLRRKGCLIKLEVIFLSNRNKSQALCLLKMTT